ncbi:hypothetical protein [Xanthomonas sp. 1678]|uniref:hypothetical protein n=1 Tax=Xanthomonas sp. 1678 TaxID=3158788 RepID=UPI002861D6B9|nr:hypothetical protein [Xanthomonas translucens]
MARSDGTNDEYDRLQQDLMRQLDAIANDIDAGRLTLEEASARSNALIEETQAKSAPLLASRIGQHRRTQRRSRVIVVIVVLLFVAYLGIKTWANLSG